MLVRPPSTAFITNICRKYPNAISFHKIFFGNNKLKFEERIFSVSNYTVQRWRHPFQYTAPFWLLLDWPVGEFDVFSDHTYTRPKVGRHNKFSSTYSLNPTEPEIMWISFDSRTNRYLMAKNCRRRVEEAMQTLFHI